MLLRHIPDMCGRFASYLPPEAIRAAFRTRNALVNCVFRSIVNAD